MALEELTKESAEKLWEEIKSHRGIFSVRHREPAFSPQSLRVIDRIFQSEDEHKAGGLLFFWDGSITHNGVMERQARAFGIGAYIGEVVRRGLVGCKWEEFDGYDEQISLSFPDSKPPIFPIRFIAEQMKNYEPGSIVEWGRKAGLKIENRH